MFDVYVDRAPLRVVASAVQDLLRQESPAAALSACQIYRFIGFTGSFALCPSCTRARLLGGGTTPVHNRK